MNGGELGNLTLLARTAYAIMCFERYVGYVYSDVDFRPAAEVMWQIVDGSAPFDEAAGRYLEIVPETLFAFDTFEQYQAAGNTHTPKERYRILKHVLNPHDRNLNTMMQHIYRIAAEYIHRDRKAGAPETLAYLKQIEAMLTVRGIALPDVRLLQKYTCPPADPGAAESIVWVGDAIDPSELSLLGITGSAHNAVSRAPQAAPAVTHEEPEVQVFNEDAGPNICAETVIGYDGYERSFAFVKDEYGDLSEFFVEPTKPVFEANGCKWEIANGDDGVVITQCINISFLKNVTVPAELNDLPVVGIEDNAFTNRPECGCQAIETLDMPDTILEIGANFFKSCTNLRQIHMSAGLRSLGHEAFRGASRLESIAIGDNCRVIGDYFCADGLALREVTIGAGIEYIGEYTFYNTPAMTVFRCDGLPKELGYGSFWVNKWADRILFDPTTELLRFCKDNALLYRYVKRTPPPRLFFDAGIKYVYDFAFGGDAWHYGDGITDIYFPGAEKIGVQVFRKTPNATVHLSASRMEAAYGQDYEYTLEKLCEPAKVVFDQP